MGRTMVKRQERTARRRGMDGALVAAAAVVVLFAAVGVVSAGTFVAGKVSSSPTSTPRTHHTQQSSGALAAQDIARAQAQATAIVKQAQNAGRSIVANAHGKAQRQARALLAAAHRQAAAAAAAAPAAAPVPTTPPANTSAVGTGTGSSGVTGASGQYQYGTTQTYGSTTTGSGVSTYAPPTPQAYTSAGSAPRATTPNLRGVPASWLVVGYNASFGTGPGSAGSISVVNRSGKTFSGVATVTYALGGSASAAFSGLAPGQAVVLPLNGARFPGGSYKITVSGLH